MLDPCSFGPQLGSLAADPCFPYNITTAKRPSITKLYRVKRRNNSVAAEICVIAYHNAGLVFQSTQKDMQ
jgi:hypothetical protein